MVFRAKRAERVKILLWDGMGLVLAYERPEQGRFVWPCHRAFLPTTNSHNIYAMYSYLIIN